MYECVLILVASQGRAQQLNLVNIGHELSGSIIKDKEFLDYLSDY
jgi:hypothetical protein